jgi:hypothetical protein
MYTDEEDLISLGKLFHRYTILLKYEFLIVFTMEVSNWLRFHCQVVNKFPQLVEHSKESASLLSLKTRISLD